MSFKAPRGSLGQGGPQTLTRPYGLVEADRLCRVRDRLSDSRGAVDRAAAEPKPRHAGHRHQFRLSASYRSLTQATPHGDQMWHCLLELVALLQQQLECLRVTISLAIHCFCAEEKLLLALANSKSAPSSGEEPPFRSAGTLHNCIERAMAGENHGFSRDHSVPAPRSRLKTKLFRLGFEAHFASARTPL